MEKWSGSGENVPSSIIETRRCQMGNLIKQEVANQIIRVEDNVFFSSDGGQTKASVRHRQLFCPLLSSSHQVTFCFRKLERVVYALRNFKIPFC